ncbi:hypothetical protein HDU91_006305 [Kappamyces sp. JEL0680]|nr:hypothetical protein HDU91_006305 [Kappamyces sp. JEL0680]
MASGMDPVGVTTINPPALSTRPELDNHTPSRGHGAVVNFASGFEPQWGTSVPDDPSFKEVINYFENGNRIIFFILGGATIAEVQAIHQSCRLFKRGFLLGATQIITPDEFTNDLCYLGEVGVKAVELPSVLADIEEERQQQELRRQDKELQLERERQKEQELAEERKRLELEALEVQRQQDEADRARDLEIQERQKEIDRMEATKLLRIQAAFSEFDNLSVESQLQNPSPIAGSSVVESPPGAVSASSPGDHVLPPTQEPEIHPKPVPLPNGLAINGRRSFRVVNSTDDEPPPLMMRPITSNNRLDTDEAASLAHTQISILIANPDEKKAEDAEKPTAAVGRAKSKLIKPFHTIESLFATPAIARQKPGGMAAAAKYRDVAKNSLSAKDALDLGYNFAEPEEIASPPRPVSISSPNRASVASPKSVGSGATETVAGYRPPPRRHIPSTATTIPAGLYSPSVLPQDLNRSSSVSSHQSLEHSPVRSPAGRGTPPLQYIDPAADLARMNIQNQPPQRSSIPAIYQQPANPSPPQLYAVPATAPPVSRYPPQQPAFQQAQYMQQPQLVQSRGGPPSGAVGPAPNPTYPLARPAYQPGRYPTQPQLHPQYMPPQDQSQYSQPMPYGSQPQLFHHSQSVYIQQQSSGSQYFQPQYTQRQQSVYLQGPPQYNQPVQYVQNAPPPFRPPLQNVPPQFRPPVQNVPPQFRPQVQNAPPPFRPSGQAPHPHGQNPYVQMGQPQYIQVGQPQYMMPGQQGYQIPPQRGPSDGGYPGRSSSSGGYPSRK